MFHSNANTDITVRMADDGDIRSLVRLAALDSAQLAEGPMVVAESDGELVAALPVDGGQAIADPFRRTADLVEMLEMRAAHLSDEHSRPSGLADRFRTLAGLPLLRAS